MKTVVEIGFVTGSDGLLSYDVLVRRPEATVADYLAALNEFQTRQVAPCGGCTNCCWERVPLTAPDALAYLAGLPGNAMVAAAEPAAATLADFAAQYCQVTKLDGVVDICLKRQADGSCCFLDQEQHRCRAHALRPLVCQSYICLPSTRRATALRSQIVNAGENELVRLLAAAGSVPEPVAGSPADSRGFAGKTSFAQVLIREISGAGLWRRLQEEKYQ